ncbi:MAG: hypothetical protein IPP39_15725 [Chitinophagaceae bacterium]|nr:hypothetical protein [Chitinophagaceae bacterium]
MQSRPFIFRWQLAVVAISLFSLMSCSGNYGEKVTFSTNTGEVYYKGDGVTEADAKAVGEFLEKQGYFSKDGNRTSVQISKKDKTIEARFVVNDTKLAAVKNADASFEIIGALMSKEVFKNEPVDVIYTDDKFADKKTIAYNPKVLESANTIAEIKDMQKTEWNNNTLYYSDNIKTDDIDVLMDYLKDKKFFLTDGAVDIIVNQSDNGDVRIRFPIKNSFNTPEGMQKIDNFASQLKKDLFQNVTLNFEVLDEAMQTVKSFTYN